MIAWKVGLLNDFHFDEMWRIVFLADCVISQVQNDFKCKCAKIRIFLFLLLHMYILTKYRENEYRNNATCMHFNLSSIPLSMSGKICVIIFSYLIFFNSISMWNLIQSAFAIMRSSGNKPHSRDLILCNLILAHRVFLPVKKITDYARAMDFRRTVNHASCLEPTRRFHILWRSIARVRAMLREHHSARVSVFSLISFPCRKNAVNF